MTCILFFLSIVSYKKSENQSCASNLIVNEWKVLRFLSAIEHLTVGHLNWPLLPSDLGSWQSIVKHVNKGHPREKHNMAYIEMWCLLGGGLKYRFGCINLSTYRNRWVISLCHQYRARPTHPCSLTRLYIVGWPTSSSHISLKWYWWQRLITYGSSMHGKKICQTIGIIICLLLSISVTYKYGTFHTCTFPALPLAQY